MRTARLVVVGPGEAGKSTLVALVCRNAVNLEVGGRTVALDHGTAISRGRKLTLIGVPGQSRFAPVRESLAVGANGVIWVHPAGAPPDETTVDLLVGPELSGLPLLVVVNLRKGSPPASPFQPPPEVHQPRQILAVDLGRSTLPEPSLVEAVWSLVEHD